MDKLYRIITSIISCLSIFMIFYSICHAEMYPFHIDLDALTGAPVSKLNKQITAAHAVHVNGHHFYTLGLDSKPGTSDDERIRFWGINLEAPLIFPRNVSEAESLALRLKKLGFNLVRIHGLDHVSSDPDITLLLLDHKTSYPALNESNLKAFDLLLDALKVHGIYVDLVLKVGYVFDSTKDCYFEKDDKKRCVPDPKVTTQRYPVSGTIPAASKPLDLFNHEMIELQKRYFSKILGRYGDRPEIALLEINNENSLIERYWSAPDVFPPLYAAELDRLWNSWLYTKYHDTASLRKAWESKVNNKQGSDLLKNGDFNITRAGKPVAWELGQLKKRHGEKYGDWHITDSKELEISIEKIPKKYWYLLLGQQGIPITEGHTYRLQFTARAEEQREIMVSVQGLGENNGAMAIPAKKHFKVSSNKEKYSICFTSNLSDTNARLTFLPIVRGGDTGKLWLGDISLSVADGEGLGDDNILKEGGLGNVPRPNNSVVTGCPGSEQMRSDYLNFLSDIENNYYKEMLTHIRDDLNVQKPITGTQANYGGLISQNNMVELMDYIDTHYYWDHPHINNKGSYTWWMRNEPMVEHPSESIVSRIAATRVYGKPYTISEYSPNQMSLYAGEGHVLTAAYAAFHDIDAVILFTYYSSGFDLRDHPNPKQLLHMYNLIADTRSESIMHFAANIFRRADVGIAKSEVKVKVDEALMVDHGLKNRNIRGILETLCNSDNVIGKDKEKFNVLLGLRSKLGLIHAEDSNTLKQTSSFMYPQISRNLSDTGELMWYTSNDKKDSYFVLDTPLSQAVTGYINRDIKLSRLLITGKGEHDQFGTVAVTSIDGKPIIKSNELLITSIGKGKNKNLEIVSEGSGVTLCVTGKKGKCKKQFWHPDSGEFVVEPNPVIMQFTTNAKSFTVERLDEKGESVAEVDVNKTLSGYEFLLGGDADVSPWYVVRLNY